MREACQLLNSQETFATYCLSALPRQSELATVKSCVTISVSNRNRRSLFSESRIRCRTQATRALCNAETVNQPLSEFGRCASGKARDASKRSNSSLRAVTICGVRSARWVTQFAAHVLQRLLRDASIQTTPEFYADLNDRDLLEPVLDAAVTNASTTVAPNSHAEANGEKRKRADFPQETGLS